MFFGPIPLAIAVVFIVFCFLYGATQPRTQNNTKAHERYFCLGMIGIIALLLGMEKTQRIECKPYPFVIYDGGDFVAAKVKDQPTIIIQSEDEMKIARESKVVYEKTIWKYMGTGPYKYWTFVKPDSDQTKEAK